jgi:hypothetical protein
VAANDTLAARLDAIPVCLVDVDCKPATGSDVPRWAMRLLYRLAQLQRGQAYTLTLIMVGDEPVWTVEHMGKVENGR